MPQKLKKNLSGWGNYPVAESYVVRPERNRQITLDESPIIARGLGRSYGDAALNSGQTVMLMERLNRFLSFDEKTGILRAEAGVSLEEILKVFVPRGWFLPVTPGTKYVTLGGCIATDVHGKNHHQDGSFGSHIADMEILLANGSRQRCSPKQEPDLFWATIGGMGLTGIITEASLKLIPIESSYMIVQHHPAKNLDAILDLLEDKSKDEKYSVAWIDCLSTGQDFGRSILMTGHHACKEEIPARINLPLIFQAPKQTSLPFNLPSWILNPWNIKAFNTLFYKSQSSKTLPFLADYDRYFYPLDSIGNWNRLYGKKGFVQYQFVVPSKNARESLKAFMDELTQSRRASFLAVLKRFGEEGQGDLSFPHEGYTLALDIPISDSLLFPFLNHLDEIILKYNGRIYLAKDARSKPDTFQLMYPRFAKWQHVKALYDPENKFSSDLSRRLKMEGKR